MDEKNSILVIDDELRLCKNIKTLLTHEGYDVVTCSDGREAIKLLESGSFNLVLTDIKMPGVDGYGIMEYIQKYHPDMLIVVMTAYVSTSSAIVALRKGAYDYLVKPFDFNMMKIVIDRAFDKIKLQRELREYVGGLEKKVQERTRELRESIEKLKATQHQLVQTEKLSAIGELISGIAHELNNPLTVVAGLSQMLQQNSCDRQLKRDLEKINSEAMRCQKLVDNLLSFARKHKPKRENTNLNKVIENTLELLSYQRKVENIVVLTEFQPDLPLAMVDVNQMQQVFLNIINNAYQAMATQGGGTLTIKTYNENGSIYVIFKDSGPGIKEEHLNKIFDPFFTTKEPGKGTGLGLSISYGIIKEHDGQISVQSKFGCGATFTLKLPISYAESCSEDQIEGEKKSKRKKGKILLVDDEANIVSLLTEVLKLEGHFVDYAYDGEQALNLINRNQYDLLVTDIKMPGMNGKILFELVKKIHPKLASNTIFLTGDIFNKETQEFVEKNAKICLHKPLKIIEFQEKVQEMLNHVE